MAKQPLSFPNQYAVIRLATYIHPELTQAHLLFASVSIVEQNRPFPTTKIDLESRSVATGGKIFFKRTIMDADAAIEWYRSAGPHMKTPRPMLKDLFNAKNDGVAMCASNLSDNPEWPTFGLFVPEFNNSELPFMPHQRHLRLHRRFGNGSPFQLVPKDPKTIAFLEQRLHLNFNDYPEYLGGLVLIAPDPILSDVQSFLVPGVESSADKTVFKLSAKPGRSLQGLTLTLLQQRAELLSECSSVPVPEDGLIEIATPNQTDAISFVISHDDYGVLVYQAPATFIRTINFGIGITNRIIEINAPTSESPKARIMKSRFPEVTQEVTHSIGQPSQSNELSTYFAASEQRRKKELAKALSQKWFMPGQRIEALEFVRAQLLSARNSVLIADPYLGPRQLIQFFHFVERLYVSLNILTSRLAFGDPPDEEYPEESASRTKENQKRKRELDRLQGFAAGLETFVERGMQKPTALVLRGKTPTLHDRFLVIDNTVWFMGNSLNALGERASLILKVPDATPVLAGLQDLQNNAKPFEEYFLQRQQSSQDSD